MMSNEKFNREQFYKELDLVYASRDIQKIEDYLKGQEWTEISKRDMARPCCGHIVSLEEEERLDTELIKTRLTIQNELMSLYRGTGRFDACLEVAELMKGEMEKIGYDTTDQYAIVLLNEATACEKKGDGEKALSLFVECEQILNKLESVDRYLLSSLYNNRAPLYLKKGDFQKALDDLTMALSILRELGGRKLEEAITLVTMSVACNGLKDFAGGEKATDEAIALYKEMGEDPHMGAAYNMKAQYRYMQKQYAEAAELFKAAAEITKKYFGENHDYQICMKNAAKAEEEINR